MNIRIPNLQMTGNPLDPYLIPSYNSNNITSSPNYNSNNITPSPSLKIPSAPPINNHIPHFIENMKFGNGTYSGYIKDNQPHGEGCWIVDNCIFKGIFENRFFVKGEIIFNDGHRHVGNFMVIDGKTIMCSGEYYLFNALQYRGTYSPKNRRLIDGERFFENKLYQKGKFVDGFLDSGEWYFNNTWYVSLKFHSHSYSIPCAKECTVFNEEKTNIEMKGEIENGRLIKGELRTPNAIYFGSFINNKPDGLVQVLRKKDNKWKKTKHYFNNGVNLGQTN